MPYTKWNFREIGDNVTIYEPVAIIRPEAMILKNHVLISEFAYLAGGMGLGIGNFIHISTHCSILGGGYCILEDFVAVSAGSRLITGTEDITGTAISLPTVPPKYRSFFRSYVHVEKFAFLATGVIVHPGVTIGEGSVVGSGSIVTKDLEPWGIYIGAPAKKVRDRPKEKILSLANQLMNEYHLSYSDFSMLLPKKQN